MPGATGSIGSTGAMGPVVAGTSGTVMTLTQSSTLYFVGRASTSNGSAFNSENNWRISSSAYLSSNSFYGAAFYETSDKRLKDVESDFVADIDMVKRIPKKYFYWKDKENRDGNRHLGTLAQDLLDVIPEAVSIGEDGIYNVDYSILSIVALSMVEKLHEEIEELKKKLQ